MSDAADFAQDLQEQLISRSLDNQKHTKTPSFSGFCLFCEEPVIERRYCDSLCREDHEKEKSKNQI